MSNKDTIDKCQDKYHWLIQDNSTNNKYLVRQLNKWILQRYLRSRVRCLMTITKTSTFQIQMLGVVKNTLQLTINLMTIHRNKIWDELQDLMGWWHQFKAAPTKVNWKTWAHNNNCSSNNKCCVKIKLNCNLYSQL